MALAAMAAVAFLLSSRRCVGGRAIALILWLGSEPQLCCCKPVAPRLLSVTASNFDKTVTKHERILLQVFAGCVEHPQTGEKAPWCAKVRAASEQSEKAADLLKNSKLRTRVAKADIMEEKSLMKKFGVKEDNLEKLPVFHYFVRGHYVNTYLGKTEASEMVEWLQDREECAYLPELQPGEVESYLRNATQKKDFALVARVKPGSDRSAVFTAAAEKALLKLKPDGLHRIRLAASPLAKGRDGNRDASLTLLRPTFEEPDAKQVKFSGRWSAEAILRWVRKRSYPTMARAFDLRMYSPKDFAEAGWEACAVLVLPGQHGGDDAARSSLQPMVEKYQKEWRFVITPFADLSNEQRDALGLEASSSTGPAISILRESRRYLLTSAEEVRDETRVKRFFADVKARRATPHFRSERAPDRSVEDRIAIGTGESLEAIILDEGRDVLVAFYSPENVRWRDEVEPLFKDLAEKSWLKGWDKLGLTLAKIDVTKNECREELTTLPKLVLYPATGPDQKWAMKQVYPPKYSIELMSLFVLEYSRNLKGVKDEL